MKDRIVCECCKQSVPKKQASCQKRTILCAACMRVLSAAAFAIGELPIIKQADWIIWIMEILDDSWLKPELSPEYKWMLECIAEAIRNRLDSGSW